MCAALLAQKSNETKDDKLQAATEFFNAGDWETASELAYSILETLDPKSEEAGDMYFLLARIFNDKVESTLAQEHAEKAERCFKAVNQQSKRAEALVELGRSYTAQNKYGQAVGNTPDAAFPLALQLFLQSNNLEKAAPVAVETGDVRMNIGASEEAALSYTQALDLLQQMQLNDQIPLVRAKLIDAFLDQGDDESAQELIEKNKRVSLDSASIILSLIQEAEIAAMNNQTAKKQALIQQAERTLVLLPIQKEKQALWLRISSLFQSENDYKNALRTQRLAQESAQEYAAIEKKETLLDIEGKYAARFELKEKEAALNESELREKTQRHRVWFLSLLSILGVLFTGFILFALKRIRQSNVQLKKQQDQIQIQNTQLQESNTELDKLNKKIVEEMSAREAIESTSLGKDKFLATMSHEMRTPMNAIVGLTHVLFQENPRDDQKEHLRTIQFNANTLSVLMNDVLDHSKIEAGKLSFNSLDFGLHHLLNDVYDAYKIEAKSNNSKLSLQIDGSIPKRINGDPTRLNQILSNFISNSIQAEKSTSIDVTNALVSNSDREFEIEFSILDNRSIEAHNTLKQLLETDVQVNSDTYKNHGSDMLGLALAKRLIELKNGSLRIARNTNNQTSIQFRLPFKAAQPETVQVAHFDSQKLNHLLGGKKILLVEDNTINQIVVKKILTECDATITIAKDGLEALEIIAHNNFDCILMDIQMPNMDGYRATAEIRRLHDKRKKSIPIIALTASAFVSEQEKARLFGMNDHIAKPFSPEELLEKVANQFQ